MRHKRAKRSIANKTSHRIAMLRNLARALFTYERITTTEVRGKELVRFAEHLITWGKRGDLHSRRLILKALPDKKIAAKIVNDVAPRYKDRNGGYTRIIKVGRRRGDAAPMVVVELV